MDKHGKCLFVSFASAYSWRTIVFHVFLFCSILAKKHVLSSSIYCPNCPYQLIQQHLHLFDDFYPWTSSIFPSAVHCLDISPNFPGFLRFFNSLFTCCSPILYSTKISPVLVLWSQHAQGEKKSSGTFSDQFHRCKGACLGMLGVSQHLGDGEDLVHPGLAVKPKPFSVLGFGDFRSPFSIFFRRSL